MTYSMTMGQRWVLTAEIDLKEPILAITPPKTVFLLKLEQYFGNLLQKECENASKVFPKYSYLGQSTILVPKISFKMLLGKKCVF